jgi:eukaryotic-like serine/threonine-protein kinase
MIGSVLGRYHILEKVGAGGMGEVYRARDGRLDRDVAIKALPLGSLKDESARKRFRQEALTLSKLNHPNIATIYDFDSQDGVNFLAMEFVDGDTLSKKTESGAIPEKEVLRWGKQIAEALEEAHEHGVIHRDLKPGNIIITRKGLVKVLDFGLAKLLHSPSDDVTLTDARGVAGTLPYMAPEQLRGEAMDPRSDIFSFGAVLYEMATGKRPFAESTAPRLIEDILHSDPPPPRALNSRISTELERIIQKSLEKDPDRRYHSAREMAVDLERLRSPTTTGTAVGIRKRSRPGRRAFVAAAAALVIVALAVVGISRWHRASAVPADAGEIKSIAVLPLANFSHDPDQDYFADGMTEALITDLSKIGALRVTSGPTVMQYKATNKPLPQIAKELHVDAILAGSVERAGGRVRISAQLVRAADDENLWAENYDRDLQDVLSLQDQVARKIVAEIRVNVTPEEKTRLSDDHETNPRAYELYEQGRYHWRKGGEAELKRSLEYYDRALKEDSKYALAYAGIADSYASLADYYLAPRDAMPKAKAAAQKALQIDDSLGAAHSVLCFAASLYDWDWNEADRECRRALELNPSDADAHVNYGDYLVFTSQFEKASSEVSRAKEIDPLSLHAYTEGAFVLFLARQYGPSIESARHAIELEPEAASAYSYQAFDYIQTRDFEKAVAQAEKAAGLDNSPLIKGFLGYVYAAAGKREQARRIAEHLQADFPRRYVCPYEIGTIYLWLGEKDKGFRWYEKAYDVRSLCIPILNTDPRLDAVRSDPRLKDLIRRVGFPAVSEN